MDSWELAVDLPRLVDPAGARATLNLGVLVMASIVESASTAERYQSSACRLTRRRPPGPVPGLGAGEPGRTFALTTKWTVAAGAATRGT